MNYLILGGMVGVSTPPTLLTRVYDLKTAFKELYQETLTFYTMQDHGRVVHHPFTKFDTLIFCIEDASCEMGAFMARHEEYTRVAYAQSLGDIGQTIRSMLPSGCVVTGIDMQKVATSIHEGSMRFRSDRNYYQMHKMAEDLKKVHRR